MGGLFSSSSNEEEKSTLLHSNNGSNESSIIRSRKSNEKKGFFNFFTSKKNNGSNRRNGSNRSNGTEDKDIFKLVKNIYFQRHAVSCANTIEKVYSKSGPLASAKAQYEKSKYAPNSGISYVGVQQCLQVCDYFSNFRINVKKQDQPNQQNPPNSPNPPNQPNQQNPPNSPNPPNQPNQQNPPNSPNPPNQPLIIFCCSELIRTQQTLFLSWLKYLKDYKKDNGKIIVLPWLNEVSLPNPGGIVSNKDNYPESLEKTITKWNIFITNLRKNINKIKADTLNTKSSLLEDIIGIESWKELFYLSPIIFKKESNDPFSNSGKTTPIKRDAVHGVKRVGNMNQFIESFKKILAEYIEKQQINLNNYDGIELVLVAHHNSAEHLMNFLLPSTHAKFEEQQLVNCEVVRLPGACLKNPGKNTGEMERIYPTKFNKELNIQINREILDENEKSLSRRERRIFVNPLFILYMSELNLFLSVNNIVKTRLKARFVDKGMKQMGNYESKERIQVKKPLFKFLFNLTVEDYLEELKNAKVYIEQLKDAYKDKQTFYDYAEMIAKIQEKIGFLESYFNLKSNDKNSPKSKKNKIQNQKSQKIQWYIKNQNKNQNIKMKEEDITKKLQIYLFGFCGLDQPAIDSIAVF
jgi:hypothetical protein